MSDRQWTRLRPLLPNKPRGVTRVDDWRGISGIVHVLQSGCRRKDAPAIKGPPKAATIATCAGLRRAHVACHVRGAGGRRQTTHRVADRQYAYEGPPLGSGRKRGAHHPSIGVCRGGRNTKVHAITDRQGRPLAFLLTPGQVADCRARPIATIRPPARGSHACSHRQRQGL